MPNADLSNVGATPTRGRARRRTARRRTGGGNSGILSGRTGAGTGIGGGSNVGGGGETINLSGLTTEQRKLWDRAYQMGVRHGCEFSGNRTNR